MPTHTAKSLFEKNIKSAKDCVALYDTISKLKPGKVNIKWVLRSAVVFTVSALDTYFHDKIKYRVGKFSLENLPPSLAKFSIPVSLLISWEKAERKGNILRNCVVDYLSTRPLQSPNVIADSMKLLGIQSFWDTIEHNKNEKEKLLKELNSLIQRRNQISHEGDRMTSRKSGKKLRAIQKQQTQKWISFAEDLINKIEVAFPG